MTTAKSGQPGSRRRGHNEGSIYQREDGYWVASIDLGIVDGKRKRKPIYGKTRAEVAKKLTAALKAKQDGLPVVSERQTLAQFLQTWLAATKPTVKPGTYVCYEQYMRVHILGDPDNLGDVPLGKLSPAHLQTLYARRLDSGLSPQTVKHLHVILKTALARAVRWDLLIRNPADRVDPPRVARHEMQTLSHEQASALLATAAGERLEALYVLALTVGMRQGELLALRWQDVDLDAGALQVRGSLRRTPDGLTIQETKTGKARRVELPGVAVQALRRHRVAQNAERLRLGDIWEDRGFVFANEVGRPIEAGNLLRRSFWPLLARAGCPRVRFHDLRHTAATLLLERGIPVKMVSEMLGHAGTSITQDLYSHVTPTMQKQATAAMDSMFPR